ncbi:hypothetical protein C0J52_16049, partial [Blattella germanica]
TANNLLLLHLGVVDALLCALFLLFSAPSLLRGWDWLGMAAPCSLYGFLFTLLHPVALWTVCGLNCDRYYAISAPLHYGAMVSPRKVALGLGAAWAVAFALCLPPLFLVAPYSYNPSLAGCAPDFGLGDGAIWYSAVYTALTLLLPAALILGCNIKNVEFILNTLQPAQVTITHQRNPFQPPVLKFRGRSAVSTVLQLLGALFVLYFPYYGVILWESSATTFLAARAHPHFFTLASTLLTCSPPINGLLYGLKSKLQRRLSEVLLDPHRSGSQNSGRPRIQRIASELNWRPASATGFPIDSSTRSHAASCNTLQVPSFEASIPDGDLAKNSIRAAVVSSGRKKGSLEGVSSLSSANLFLQRVFGIGSSRLYTPGQRDNASNSKRAAAIQTVLASTPRRSPRILITRAFSEESDKSPPTAGRTYSTSTTSLLERRRRVQGESSDSESGLNRESNPLHDSKSSVSSTDDDNSSGRLYFSLDASEGTSESGEGSKQLGKPSANAYILSWPTTRKKKFAVQLTRSFTDITDTPEFVL